MKKANENENSPFCDDLIPVTIKYTKNNNGSIVIIRDKKGSKKIGDKTNILTTTWTRMSFQDANEIMSISSKVDEENGLTTIDWGIYRKLMMERNLKEWNIEGRPCNSDNMNKLDIVIATELIDQYIVIAMPNLLRNNEEFEDEFDDTIPMLVSALTQLEENKQTLNEVQKQNGDLSRRVTMLEERVLELDKNKGKKK